MALTDIPEVWLRGPVPHIPALLQPVAHALLQAREEVNELMTAFPDTHLWEKPAGVASPGFHLQHMVGILDRLFTYATGNLLTQQQLDDLYAEGQLPLEHGTVQDLLNKYNEQVEKAMEQLRNTDEAILNEPRGVGRAQIASTVIGLMVHAAEHTMRHVGQLLVTVSVLNENRL